MKLAKRYQAAIDEICDERNSGGNFFVYLRAGFIMDAQHCFGAIDAKEIRETMQRVKSCDCVECTDAIKNGRTW